MSETNTLHRIVYVSSSYNELSDKELEEILTTSRENNSKKNITGILIYNEGNILQVLEGAKKDLRTLFGVISQDTRHHSCIILQDTPSCTRSFADWSMGFKPVSQIEFLQLSGHFDFKTKNLPLINEKMDFNVRTILETFIKHSLKQA